MNELREEFVDLVHSQSPDVTDRAIGECVQSQLLSTVRDRLLNAELQLPHLDQRLAGHSFRGCVRKGGRNHNYDFEFEYEKDDSTVQVRVELKRGDSIYSQPQFLNLIGSHRPELIDRNTPRYGEDYFFENYLAGLLSIARIRMPTHEQYAVGINDVKYSGEPFRSLYRWKKASEQGREACRVAAHESIDAYLRQLCSGNDGWGIDFEEFQLVLSRQVDKWFLSWNPHDCDFVWESFDARDLQLDGTVHLKAGRSGVNTLILPTNGGKEVHALLKWNNNLAVAFPGWQVKLVRPHGMAAKGESNE